jgi:hypothetical protein
MELDAMQERVNAALRDLHEHDDYLLIHDLHERTIAHKLAGYLQAHFSQHQVDCEYNGNCESESGRKVIYTLNNELNAIRARVQPGEESSVEEEESLRVYPDIIIHRRGENNHNLLIIEIKKSSNRRHQQFDKDKLQAFTSSSCEFQFRYGLFLEIGTVDRVNQNSKMWYESGTRLPI